MDHNVQKGRLVISEVSVWGWLVPLLGGLGQGRTVVVEGHGTGQLVAVWKEGQRGLGWGSIPKVTRFSNWAALDSLRRAPVQPRTSICYLLLWQSQGKEETVCYFGSQFEGKAVGSIRHLVTLCP